MYDVVDLVVPSERLESDSGCRGKRLHDALAHHRVVLPCSRLEQGPSVLAENLTLGLKRDHVDLSVLVDNVDGRASGVGKVDDLLGAHVPSHFDAFSLELDGVDDGSTRLHVELSGEFLASFIVDRRPHFC